MIVIQDLEKNVLSIHTSLKKFQLEYNLTNNQYEYFRKLIKKGKSVKYKDWIIYKT